MDCVEAEGRWMEEPSCKLDRRRWN